MEAAAQERIVDESLPVDPTDSDEDLMLRYARGDGTAFEILFRRHKARVYSFIYRFVGGGHTADDLYQEVFLRIIRSRHTYRPRARFTTWLYAVARSVCIDAIRKENRRTDTASLDELNETGQTLAHLPVTQGTQRDEVFQSETGALIERFIQMLPQEQREVLLMRERLNLTFREIASITGCTVGTVKSRMRYALESLRKWLIAEGFVK